MWNKKLKVLSIVFYFFVSGVYGQQYIPDRFFVTFKDKANSGYTLSSPGDFLSPEALDRRHRMDIPVDSFDLPVSGFYLDSLKAMGAKVHNTTKWLNGAVISPDTLALISEIMILGFVDRVEGVRYKQDTAFMQGGESLGGGGIKHIAAHSRRFSHDMAYDYGYAENQNFMLNVHRLHNDGYNGEGVLIAVLDAGFYGVDKMSSLRHLYDNQQIVSTRDFVSGGLDVFHSSTHGQMVLSVMASDFPGISVGTAPGASYALFRSEDVGSEYPVEELYWASAAEHADSLGADIINSSLGYTTFDYDSLDYKREDMDGNTTYISRAANTAASRGILVVSSAGNLGDLGWFYISAPADADSVLSVGAVDQQGNYASFSSKGPAYGGAIKPNVAAVGAGTYFLNTLDQLAYGNGTSFSAPLISGAAASLWQAFPGVSNRTIKEVIERSGSQYLQPDSLTGYGIPNFQLAAFLIRKTEKMQEQHAAMDVLPNPFESVLYLLSEVPLQDAKIEIYDLRGRLIKRLQPAKSAEPDLYICKGLQNLSNGAYLLRVSNEKINRTFKIFKAG